MYCLHRDQSGSLDDADIDMLCQSKPDTANLEDHNYDPHEDVDAEESDNSNVNFKAKQVPKRVQKERPQNPGSGAGNGTVFETDNPVEESPTAGGREADNCAPRTTAPARRG